MTAPGVIIESGMSVGRAVDITAADIAVIMEAFGCNCGATFSCRINAAATTIASPTNTPRMVSNVRRPLARTNGGVCFRVMKDTY